MAARRPTLFANQRHECNGAKSFLFKLGFALARELGQDLIPLFLADRNDQPTADRKLLLQRRGTSGPPAATRIALKGAASAHPRVPSPTRSSILS